jgi:hypothetical protein
MLCESGGTTTVGQPNAHLKMSILEVFS